MNEVRDIIEVGRIWFKTMQIGQNVSKYLLKMTQELTVND